MAETKHSYSAQCLCPDCNLQREYSPSRILEKSLGPTASHILATSPGGEHYRKQAIEPIVYIERNHIPFHEGNIIKYVTRWRDKGGLEDLRKAEFYIKRLIELEEGKHGGA